MATLFPDSRTTFRLLKFALVIAFIVITLLGCVTIFGSSNITATVDIDQVQATVPLPDGAEIVDSKLEIPASQLNDSGATMFRIYFVVQMAVMLLIVLLLIQIVDDMMKNKVFVQANVKRLQTIAVLLFLGLFEQPLTSLVTSAMLDGTSIPHSSGLDLTFDFMPIVYAFAVFAVAEVFAAGIKRNESPLQGASN